MKRFYQVTFLILLVVTGNGSVFAASDGGQAYKTECGSCHVPFPTVFLNTASWKKVMNGLSDHFGDNAELDAGTQKKITDWLATHNYDQSGIKRRVGSRFDSPTPPLRLTNGRFFKAVHHEIPDSYVGGNPKVKSFSHCDACHRSAADGFYDEEDVRIPR